MDCPKARDWLLSAEDVRPEACGHGPLADHLLGCAQCRQFAARLAELEDAWRKIPLPDECERAKQAILARLATAPSPDAKCISRRGLLRRFALASAATVLAGAGGWMFFGSRQAEASADLMDSLLDWNLRLTQADSAELRRRLYAEAAPGLESAVARVSLPAEQSGLATAMLENGKWLAKHRDPLGEAARFDDLAERLLRMARGAGKKGKYQGMHHLLKQYSRATESGMDLNLWLAEDAAARDAHRQQEFQRLISRGDARMQELAEIEPTAPEPTRKEIQRALKVHRQHDKKAGPS